MEMYRSNSFHILGYEWTHLQALIVILTREMLIKV